MNKKKMQRPTSEKFVYDLSQLPSTFAVDAKHDIEKFNLRYLSIVRMHKNWLQTEETSYLFPCTNYPLTSGELAMLHFRKNVKK